MEERRFDDLTRKFGFATSRRQVFKAALGGVAAVLLGRAVSPAVAEAAPAEVCNRAACKAEAGKLFVICNQTCSQLSGRHGYGHEEGFGCVLACIGQAQYAERQCATNASGCLTGACCNQQCVSLLDDAQNCGACGTVCSPGNACVDGKCQCGDNGTMCNDECVDTQIDKNHCGNCETQCKTCEACAGGACGLVDCGTGQSCCNDQCVDDCPQGQQRDPETCQCLQCVGQTNGTTCGTNEVCCQELCLNNQCPTGKTFDYSSCACICTPVDCPDGEQQDPDSCACVDKCDGVTCGTCESCDPETGTCITADNNTDCGGGNVCCNGTCQVDCVCTGLPCSNGDCCANADDFACCLDGCCPQVMIPGSENKGAACLAPGSGTYLGAPAGNCCQPSDIMKLSYVDPTTSQCDCSGTGGFGTYCDGNLPPDIGFGTPCGCGHWFS